MSDKTDEKYGARESQQRVEAALKAAFQTPHKTYEDSKVGKRKPRPTASPGRRKPVKKSG